MFVNFVDTGLDFDEAVATALMLKANVLGGGFHFLFDIFLEELIH